MQQRDAEWFAMRAGKFTGSRFCDLMARTKSGPSTSRANLIATLAVERLTGMCVETFSNAAMQRGTDMEPEARAAYEVTAGVMVQEVAWIQHPDVAAVGASPDGLIGADGILEIKCPAAMAKHLDAIRTGSHAVEYKWQCQGLLWVSGRHYVDICSYDPRWPEKLQLAITRVERDESAIEDLRAECEKAERELQRIVDELRERLEVVT